MKLINQLDNPQTSTKSNLPLVYSLWLAFATFILLSLLTSLSLLLLEAIFEPTISSPSPTPSTDNATTSGLFLVVAIITAMLITYSLLILMTKDYFKSVFRPQMVTSLGWSVFSVAAGIVIAIIVHWLGATLPSDAQPSNTFDVIKDHGQISYALLIVLVVLLAPIVEEYLFRGVILDPLRARFDTLVAICLSAVVFMGFHLIEYYDYWVGIVAMLGLGVVLAIVRIKSRSLLNPILCHASYNLFIILLA